LGLGLELNLLRDARRRPTRGIVGPLMGQKELPVEHGVSVRTGIGQGTLTSFGTGDARADTIEQTFQLGRPVLNLRLYEIAVKRTRFTPPAHRERTQATRRAQWAPGQYRMGRSSNRFRITTVILDQNAE
jgi:hypothetical protein